jgi:hypothetical protein
VKTPQQAAANWLNSAGRASADYQAGVESYSGDWAGATTRQQAVLVNNWNQAVTSGRWAAGVQNRGTNGWKQATVAKVGNYSTGFQAGASRQAAAIAKIMQAEANIVNSLPPRGDFAQNVNRATSFITQLHALKGSLGA